MALRSGAGGGRSAALGHANVHRALRAEHAPACAIGGAELPDVADKSVGAPGAAGGNRAVLVFTAVAVQPEHFQLDLRGVHQPDGGGPPAIAGALRSAQVGQAKAAALGDGLPSEARIGHAELANVLRGGGDEVDAAVLDFEHLQGQTVALERLHLLRAEGGQEGVVVQRFGGLARAGLHQPRAAVGHRLQIEQPAIGPNRREPGPRGEPAKPGVERSSAVVIGLGALGQRKRAGQRRQDQRRKSHGTLYTAIRMEDVNVLTHDKILI